MTVATTVEERILRLRQRMARRGIDICIVPSADYHQSEYVGEAFKAREYLTGFTGSAGTAVFTKEEACLWTDGRYFLQAEAQLSGTKIQLMKMGEPGVPSLETYLKKTLPQGGTLGFDGRVCDVEEGKKYEEIAAAKGGHIVYEYDLPGEIWEGRPTLSCRPAFALDLRYAGESCACKLERVRQVMKELETDLFLVTSLDDIGWLLNIRGQDVEYCPLLLSYAVIRQEAVELYADKQKFSEEILEGFRENHVEVYPYPDIYERVKKFDQTDKVLLDSRQMNYALYRNIPAGVDTVETENPIIFMKAVKNQTEVENIRKAHMKDGVAYTKFMYWLKKNVGKTHITERSASKKLEDLRAETGHFLGPSFAPICAYREHAAIVHYSSTPETDVELQAEGLFLTDTGGHYYEGSTDITRTIALGEISPEEKEHFTMVAVSMLNLADTKFLYGCTGLSLDCIAREPFWRRNLNFNHGTGHGVGYLGNIHEPPARFQWKYTSGKIPVLEEYMVITDEPGIYIEGSHGVRTENELLVRKGEKNAYGQFMYFEILTLAPIDLDAIEPGCMEPLERKRLNDYHRRVYAQISPWLTEEEREWLKEYTREI